MSYSHSNPEQLLMRAKAHFDAEDFGQILELYRHYLKMLARVQIGERLQGKVDASDVVQDVFLRAMHGFPQFRGKTEQEFLNWLRRILSTVLANTVRKFYGTSRRDARLERELDERLDHTSNAMQRTLIADSPSPSEQLAAKERAVLVANAMECLPEDYREVIALRHFEQLSFPEISERMGRTLNSIKNIWPRALAALRHQMKELE